jgi:hypothetical protein
MTADTPNQAPSPDALAYTRGRDHAENIETESGEVPPADEHAPADEPNPIEWQRGYDDYRDESERLLAPSTPAPRIVVVPYIPGDSVGLYYRLLAAGADYRTALRAAIYS